MASLKRRTTARAAAAAGRGVTRKLPDGTVVTYDTDPVMVAVMDGLADVAIAIGEQASRNAPDYPTYRTASGETVPQPSAGFGLPSNWGVMTWAFGKLTYAQTVTGDTGLKKPRQLRLERNGVSAMVGFGFPGYLVETGTVHTRAQPFLGPAALAVGNSGEALRMIRARVEQFGKP